MINELLTIKIELEHLLIDGGDTEILLLTSPCFAQVRTFKMETLFACKLLAILNRSWKTRIKGRDFYDYLFYIQNNISINFEFLRNGLIIQKHLKESDDYDFEDFKNDLKIKFDNVNFDVIYQDVFLFVQSDDLIKNSINREVFLLSIQLLKIQ